MKSSFSRKCGVALFVAALAPVLLWAGAPAWWADRGVITPGVAADDYAAANKGQVKYIAQKAYEEFSSKGLLSPTNDAITAMVQPWATPSASTDDFQAINLGQLKTVAEPFYARLQQLGYTGQPLSPGQTRPWSGAADDYALANIGQVKNLFSFDLEAFSSSPPVDTDDDGLSDADELMAGTSPTNPDTDGDGVRDGREVAAGRKPTAKDEPLHALIDFPEGFYPELMGKDGTIVLRERLLGNSPLYRWKSGLLELLEFPPLAEGAEPGDHSVVINNQGVIGVNLQHNNSSLALVWLQGASNYIELSSPTFLVIKEYEDPYYAKGAGMMLISSENRIWGNVSYTRFTSTFSTWASPTSGPTMLGETYFVGGSIIFLGGNNSGSIISYKLNQDATGSYYVGSNPVPFETKAINAVGWVLGIQNHSNGTNNRLLYKDTVTINLPNWNLTGLDDDNNLYGVTSGGRKAMWTKDKDNLVSDPTSAIAYEPVEYVPVIMPAGWTSNHEVIHGSLAPQLGIGQFTDPAVAGATAQTKPFLLIPAEIAVDNNRDGKIKMRRERYIASEDDSTSQEIPFRFWSNDDDNNSEPDAAPEKDYTNSNVDGYEDLSDFFPVYLDIKQLLEVLPPTVATYKLKQADGALNFVYTSLTRTTAFDYEYGGDESYGPGADEPAIIATTQQITDEGVPLTADFLNRIKDQNQGIILVEARKASAEPLRLIVEKNGDTLTEVVVHLAIAQIERPRGSLDGKITPTAWLADKYRFDFQGVSTKSPGPYTLEIRGDIPAGYDLQWSLSSSAGTLENPSLAIPSHLAPEEPGSGILNLELTNSGGLVRPDLSRKVRIYRDHLERSRETFGVGTPCGTTPWHFTAYGVDIKMPSPWNCHGSVVYMHDGSGNGSLSAQNGLESPMSTWPQVGNDLIIEFAQRKGPIDWASANITLERGDVIIYTTRDGLIDHSEMLLSSTKAYAANNLWVFIGNPPVDWAESQPGLRFSPFPDDEEFPPTLIFPVKVKVVRPPRSP